MNLDDCIAFHVASLLLVVVSAFPQSTPGQSRFPELQRGIVVDAVQKGWKGDQAGIREEDVLLRWSCGDGSGDLDSPFDLRQIEIDKSSAMEVTIEGLRGSEKQSWKLGLGDWGWGLEVRPNFPSTLRLDYLQGRQLAGSGQPKEAATRWRRMAADLPTPDWLESWMLFHAAEQLSAAQEWKESDELYRAAVHQAPETHPAVAAQIMQAWAEAFRRRSDWDNAEKLFREAMQQSRKSGGDNQTTAISLSRLGTIAATRGDLAHAEEDYRQSLLIREKLVPGSLYVSGALSGLAIVTYLRGELQSSRQYYLQALAIQRKLSPGGLGEALTLRGLGEVGRERGDFIEAEKFFRQSLAIYQKLSPESIDVPQGLANLGTVFLLRGDLAKAEDYLSRALEIERKLVPESLYVAKTLGNLAQCKREDGDAATAETYYRQVLMIEKKLAPDTDSATLEALGILAMQRNDLTDAEDYYRQALAANEKLAPSNIYGAIDLDRLGDLFQKKGDLEKAADYYRQALAIQEKLVPESKDRADSLAALAEVMARQGHFDVSAQLFEQAFKVLGNQVALLGGSEDVRAGFRAKYEGYYREYVGLLVALKRPELAFEVLESSRARSLLELLTAAHVDIRRGGDAALLQEERLLQESITAKSNRRLQMLGSAHFEERLAAMDKELNDLLVQYKDVEEQIRLNSPGYAALTQPESLSATQIQHQLLDSDSLLLEYSLGEEHSYVFAVTSDSLAVFELPGRDEIENEARRVYELLTAANHGPANESARQRERRLAEAEREYTDAASRLSRMILTPVAAQLPGKRLLVVADGALQYVPFAALPLPGTNGVGSPLVLEHEVINLPSASVLAVVRREESTHAPALHEVAVVADPVFSDQDVRVESKNKAVIGKGQTVRGAEPEGEDISDSGDASLGLLTRSLRDLDWPTGTSPHLSRLLFTREEAEAILAVVPSGAGMKALDFDASRDTVTSPGMRSYRIVHFATHGILDSEHPEFSGLVFSLVDKHGQPQDGFLNLENIYNLNLPVELVVLSGCETGLGKEINGEGIVGLTRGFMYAGADRVMASLWKIDDMGTASLMSQFYRALQKEKKTPPAALREAQIAMLRQKRWHAPYYWAAFQMHGEWR